MSGARIKKGEFLVFLVVLLIPVVILWVIGVFINPLYPQKPMGILYILVIIPIVSAIVVSRFSSYVRIKFKDVVKPEELDLLIKIISLSFVSLTGNVTALFYLVEKNSFTMGSFTLLFTLLGGIWLLFHRINP